MENDGDRNDVREQCCTMIVGYVTFLHNLWWKNTELEGND